jgi:outer membrane immunogenic protein
MKHHFITRTALATLVLAGAVIGVAETASAADLAPLPVPVASRFSWTGCYVGGYIGFATANTWQSTDLGSTGPVPAPLFSPIGANPWSYSENTSFVGGGNAGCNYQLWSGPANSVFGGLVVGIEGEGGYMSLSGSAVEPLSIDVIGSSKLGNTYGLIAGRLGWVMWERVLVYGKAGVAFYDTSATVSAITPGPGAPDTITATGSKSQAPFAVGGGVEYAMWDHWTGKFEYMWLDGKSGYNACGTDSILGQSFCWQQKPSPVNLVKVGLNYKF